MEIDGWYRSTLVHGCQQRVDRVSPKYRPTISRLLTAYRPTNSRLSPDTWFGRHSTDYCLLLVECRSCISQLVNRAATNMSIAGRSRCRSITTIDRHSIAGVHMIRPLYWVSVAKSFWKIWSVSVKQQKQVCIHSCLGRSHEYFLSFSILVAQWHFKS